MTHRLTDFLARTFEHSVLREPGLDTRPESATPTGEERLAEFLATDISSLR